MNVACLVPIYAVKLNFTDVLSCRWYTKNSSDERFGRDWRGSYSLISKMGSTGPPWPIYGPETRNTKHETRADIRRQTELHGRPLVPLVLPKLSTMKAIYLSIYLSLGGPPSYLSIYLSIYLYIYICMYLSIYLFIYLSIYLSIYLYIYIHIYIYHLYIYIYMYHLCIYI
jgi:hypothetical protein